MFVAIQAPYRGYEHIIDQMHQLRKRVFADELGWDVPVHNGRERDYYDGLQPLYLVWCSDDRTTLYAAARLMPTTGPTLLHDVFHRTMPNATLCAPHIWEATRLCVDKQALARDLPQIDPGRAFGLMMIGITECALLAGITAVAANHEPHVARVYRRAGARFDQIGQADGYGKRPVRCSLFEISPAALTSMQEALKVNLPLYRKAKPNNPITYRVSKKAA